MNIKVQGRHMIDDEGRVRIFNGINLVYKGEMDDSEPGGRRYTRLFDPEQFKALKDKGINLIRMGIIWDAIEHEMGHYNDDYLGWVEDVLDQCKANGIAVFLDMHQDLYSRIFDGGAPEWATITDGADHIKGDLWSDAYLFSGAVNKAYKNFWDNRLTSKGIGLLDHYEALWLHVIEAIGHHDALIGYDFINEPFPGQNSLEIMGSLLMTYAALTGQNKSPEEMMRAFQDEAMKFQLLQDIDDSELFKAMAEQGKPLVEAFDTGHLADFYNRMTRALRKKTSDGLILTENCYFSNMGIESSVQRVQVNGVPEPLQVFSPHGYDLVVDTPAVIYASNNRIKTILDAHKRVQDRLKIPVIFGEWGAHGRYEEGLDHIRYILNYFDKEQWSHTYYCWEDNIEHFPVAHILARPYPQAVAGCINHYGYSFELKEFKMSWTEKEILNQPTQIYLPKVPASIDFDGEYRIESLDHGPCYVSIEPIGHKNRSINILM